MHASELEHTPAESVLTSGTQIFVPYTLPESAGEMRFHEASVPHNFFRGFSIDEVMGLLLPRIKKDIAKKEGVNVADVRLLKGSELSDADVKKIRAVGDSRYKT
jgi:hypothetical protein